MLFRSQGAAQVVRDGVTVNDSAPTHPLVSNRQLAAQPSAPLVNPSEVQLAPFRLLPSQVSPASMLPFPQVLPMAVASIARTLLAPLWQAQALPASATARNRRFARPLI